MSAQRPVRLCNLALTPIMSPCCMGERCGRIAPPAQNPAGVCQNWPPQPIAADAAMRKAGCDVARDAARSCSPPPAAQNFPRQSLPSPPRSSVAAAALPSEPQRAENCAHQLANYLANQPPCLAWTRQDHPFTLSPRKTGTALRLRPSAVFRQCKHCGEMFEAGPGTGRKFDALYCCDDHKIVFNSQKRRRRARGAVGEG